MSASQLETFLQLVGHDIYKQCVVREPIATAQRLVLTLRFLASGDSITSMSFQYLVGVTTANKIISQVCKSIWKNVWPIILPSNFSEEKWLKISDEFVNKWHFPHCIGAIGGKHIIIQCPRKAGSSYYNYKGSHSVVLLVICTGPYIFSFVDIGSYGRQSDAGIYKESQIDKLFESRKINLPPACPVFDEGPILPFCIIGDEAFPLKSYLLRPYPGKSATTQEKQVFNFLSRTRRTIENIFGILASRWRIFRKPILSNPEHVIQFTQATICLHNWLRIEDMENEDLKTPCITPEMVDRDDADNGLIPGLWRNDVSNAFQETSRTGNNAGTRKAFEIREKFCNYLNNEGSLGWQYDYL